MIELREIAHTIEEYTVMNDYLAVRTYHKCILGCRLYVNIDLLYLKDLSHRGQLSKFFEMVDSYLFINCPLFFSIWSVLISFYYNHFLWDSIHLTSQIVHKSKKFLKILKNTLSQAKNLFFFLSFIHKHVLKFENILIVLLTSLRVLWSNLNQ